jgi:hypothetical protein
LQKHWFYPVKHFILVSQTQAHKLIPESAI